MKAELDPYQCPDCSLKVPDPKETPEFHGRYHARKGDIVPWGRVDVPAVWNRTFLFGEEHTVPFVVTAADRLTSTTYNVHMKRECPLMMNYKVTKVISQIAGLLAAVMAVTSVTNIVALERQCQFMALAASIDGVPETYQDFVDSLKGISLWSFDWLPFDWFHIPTWDTLMKKKAEVLEHIEKAADEEIHRLADGQDPLLVRLELQYCAAHDLHPDHPEYRKVLLEINVKRSRRLFASKNKDTNVGDHMYCQSGASISEKERIEHTMSEFDGTFYFARSDYEYLLKESGCSITDLINRWPEDLPCNGNIAGKILEPVKAIHKMEEVKHMLSNSAGAFVLMTIFLGLCIWFYGSIYVIYIKNNQTRPLVLEPRFLCIFIFDYYLIRFTVASAKVLAKPEDIHLYFHKPSPEVVRAFALFLFLAYPVFFCIVIWWQIRSLTHNHKLVWNETFKKWTDPGCRHMKVTWSHWLLEKIGVASLVSVEVRACIPVLSPDGELLEYESTLVRDKKEEDALRCIDREVARDNVIEESKKKMKAEKQAAQELLLCNVLKHSSYLKMLFEKSKVHTGKCFSYWKLHSSYQAAKKKLFKKELLMLESSSDTAQQPYVGELIASQNDYVEITSQQPYGSSPRLQDLSATLKDETKGKKRGPLERLDAEEKFALLQWIDGEIQEESKLRKFQIMDVEVGAEPELAGGDHSNDNGRPNGYRNSKNRVDKYLRAKMLDEDGDSQDPGFVEELSKDFCIILVTMTSPVVCVLLAVLGHIQRSAISSEHVGLIVYSVACGENFAVVFPTIGILVLICFRFALRLKYKVVVSEYQNVGSSASQDGAFKPITNDRGQRLVYKGNDGLELSPKASAKDPAFIMKLVLLLLLPVTNRKLIDVLVFFSTLLQDQWRTSPSVWSVSGYSDALQVFIIGPLTVIGAVLTFLLSMASAAWLVWVVVRLLFEMSFFFAEFQNGQNWFAWLINAPGGIYGGECEWVGEPPDKSWQVRKG
jgi:hypothetical protein